MPRHCEICDHSQRSAIETVLKNNRKTFQKVSEEFLVSPSGLFRHKKNHMEMNGDVLNAGIKFDRATLEHNWFRYDVEVTGTLVGQLYLRKDLDLITKDIKVRERS